MSGKPNNMWLKTMIDKHGSKEAVRDFMAKVGSIGGSAKVKKGFATNHVLAVEAGRKGGTISKRGPSKILKEGILVKEAIS